jgi:hypothetical protein
LDQSQLPEINRDVRATLETHGVPGWFIDKALATKSSGMWYPTKGELLAAKVIDSVVDAGSFGFSGIKTVGQKEPLAGSGGTTRAGAERKKAARGEARRGPQGWEG